MGSLNPRNKQKIPVSIANTKRRN